MKVDAVILSYKRRENIQAVIRGLKKQSFIGNIYVFHNAPSKEKVKGAINLFSSKNFGPVIRHAVGTLVETKHVLFVDDDLELKEDLSNRFISALELAPESIIGLFGSNVDELIKSGEYYLSGGKCEYSSFPRFVDIVIGRIQFLKKRLLLNSLEYFDDHPYEMIGDDIILNLSVQLRTQVPSIIVPSKPETFVNLKAPYAQWKKKEHFSRRSLLIERFIGMGWQPLANTEKYLQQNRELAGKGDLFELYRMRLEKFQDDSIEALIDEIGIEKLPSEYIYRYAGCLRDQKKIEEAKEKYSFLLERNSNIKFKGLSAFHLGNIFLDQGKKYEAKEYFELCVQFVPNHQKAKERLFELTDKDLMGIEAYAPCNKK